MDYQTGLCFVNFLIAVFGIPDSTQIYSVHLDPHSFDDAQELCASDGFLANMPNQEETLKILKVIENKRDRSSTSFWIGLKKERTLCVQENLPLKGFYWTIDNSTKSDLNKWKEEPSATCTNALCGQLSVEYGDSTFVSWGLAAKSCNKKFPFICKHEGLSKNIACPSLPLILGQHDILQKDNDPYTLWVSCIATDTFTLTCSKSTGEWKLVGGTETDIQGLCLECRDGYKKDQGGNCVDIDECKQLNNCTFRCINTVGSYNCGCFDDLNNFHSSEDSEICKKAKTSIFTSATDATNKVQDKPTSSSMASNSPPSSQPVIDSNTNNGVHIEESTGDLSNIVIPLIIAFLIFVVLVVIIAASVKYCLMRRARKRAKKSAAVLKESIALNGSDSMERVNE